MAILRNLRRILFLMGGLVGWMASSSSLCVAGGLDWLLPPLRTPCPTATTPPPRVSIQTTYTPRFGGGLLGGGWETIPGQTGPGSSSGIIWARGTAPVVLTPMSGGSGDGRLGPGAAYLCVPYILPSPGGFYGGRIGSVPCPGILLLPGHLPGASPCVPSTSWHPLVEPVPVPSAVPNGTAGSVPTEASVPFSASGGEPSLGIPLLPAYPVEPSLNGRPGKFHEKAENSLGKNPRDVASEGSLEGKAVEPSARPLVPIPEENSPPQGISPGSNPPLNPPKLNSSPSNPPQESQHLLPPSFTPLRRSGPMWNRPAASGSGKPDPRDRTT